MATQSNPLIDDGLVDFLLYSVLDAEGLCQLGAYEQHSKETFDLYIDSVRRFARRVHTGSTSAPAWKRNREGKIPVGYARWFAR